MAVSLAFAPFAKRLELLGDAGGSDLGFVSGNLCSEICRLSDIQADVEASLTKQDRWVGGGGGGEGSRGRLRSLNRCHSKLHLFCTFPLWTTKVPTFELS